MGDRATLAKAKKELEDLYLGVPDDSVNLTFQDFAQVRQQEKTKPPPSPTMETISEKMEKSPRSSPLSKLPSLDFTRGLEASFPSQSHPKEGGMWDRSGYDHHHSHHHRHHLDHGGDQRSMAYDDASMAYGPERGGRRRPGIPHSNICTVCGRVYCRQCVNVGMGEMAEGRKCIECLGRRFSQRYIHKAGNIGWCVGYRSMVKQQELKWAERGARRSGDNRYARSRSPVPPTTPPSFIVTSPYSPTNHHPLPF